MKVNVPSLLSSFFASAFQGTGTGNKILKRFFTIECNYLIRIFFSSPITVGLFDYSFRIDDQRNKNLHFLVLLMMVVTLRKRH